MITRFRQLLLQSLKRHGETGALPFGADGEADYEAIRALAIRFPGGADWKEFDLFDPPDYVFEDASAAE